MYEGTEPFLQNEVQDYLEKHPHAASAYVEPEHRVKISEEEEYRQLMAKLSKELPKTPRNHIKIRHALQPNEFERERLTRTKFKPSHDYFSEIENNTKTQLLNREIMKEWRIKDAEHNKKVFGTDFKKRKTTHSGGKIKKSKKRKTRKQK